MMGKLFVETKQLALAAIVLLGMGCAQNDATYQTQSDDTLTSGTIHISVDESFKPVIDSQIQVFESSYPNAKIIAHYKPEAECLKDLLNDSIRMVIVTRPTTAEEQLGFADTLGFKPSWGKLAYDAVALIAHPSNPDTVLDMQKVKTMIKGQMPNAPEIVFDGLKATSTVRYALDSLIPGFSLSEKATAATNSVGVIDYVAQHPKSYGLIGVSWIGNSDDSAQLSFLQKVKICALSSARKEYPGFVKPYQANIATRRYPMVRSLYYVLKENYAGLGKGFVNFMMLERGQLIFRRAYLWPAQMGFTVRKAQITQ